MVEAGIYRGDTVVVQSQQHARNGDIVVALIDNVETTIKRLRYRDNDQIQLKSDNPQAADLILAKSRVTIQGKVIGQIRQYL